jgi:aspartyl-tRNA(Asn)/glutamyl-tRNA(Gln) amidotransferase subunit A
MLGVIAGYHPSDETCSRRPLDDYLGALTGDLRGLRIGVERAHHFPPGADPALAECFDAALTVLASLGAELVDVSLPYYDEVTVATMATLSAEALAYHRSDMQSRWADYFAGTRWELALGALMSGADYVQAQRVRRAAQRILQGLFADVDLVVGPTAAVGATPYADLGDPEWLDRFIATIFTPYWDATGHPVLVVPMGFTEGGLPLSLQLAARPFEEAAALKVGDAFQNATDWHLRVPLLAAVA